MKNVYLYISALAVFVASCSNIAEDERLELAEKTTIINGDFSATVLVEDFTGQRCRYCPEGTRLLTNLQESYGEDKIIPVAIHSGGLGFSSNKGGLMTALGEYYWDKNGFSDQTPQPCAIFNRRITSDKRSEWSSVVVDALKNETNISIQGEAVFTENRDVKITVDVTSKMVISANLQLWLLENGIVALQIDLDKKVSDYIHNHVLREAINGNDGEKINLLAEKNTFEKMYTIPSTYNLENCYIVAFVYDTNGVLQAKRIPITLKQ